MKLTDNYLIEANGQTIEFTPVKGTKHNLFTVVGGGISTFEACYKNGTTLGIWFNDQWNEATKK